MKIVVTILVVILLVLHQDYWNWSDGRLWFGFLPHAIAWHVVVSLLAAAAWWFIVQFCWSSDKMGLTTGEEKTES